jgi:hypothetical protein
MPGREPTYSGVISPTPFGANLPSAGGTRLFSSVIAVMSLTLHFHKGLIPDSCEALMAGSPRGKLAGAGLLRKCAQVRKRWAGPVLEILLAFFGCEWTRDALANVLEEVGSRGNLPHLRRAVPTSGDNALPIGRERHAGNYVLMAAQGELLLPAGGVPQLLRIPVKRIAFPLRCE